MSKSKPKSHAQQFQDVFSTLSLHHGSRSVWADFVVMAACSISNCVDVDNRASREKMYLNVSKQYTAAELDHFVQLFVLTVEALEDNPDQDFLGEIFNQLELYNKDSGQFFTPYTVAKMMALMLCGNPADEIAEKGYFSVSDPCCGAGALLIGFANAAREQGVDYQRDVIFAAQDIDFKVAMMCYIQLSMLGCSGYVIVGNSLLLDPPERENIWIMPMGMVIKSRRKNHDDHNYLSNQPGARLEPAGLPCLE